MSTDAAYELNKIHPAANKHSLGNLVCFAKGLFTSAGGDAAETIPVVGLEVGDVVIVTVNVEGAGPQTILSAIAAAGQIDVVMSADPSTDHVLNYIVFKA